VTFDGEVVVKGSRDPETDLARALLAKGITGMVKVLDANTGKHRSTVNIEKAAKLRADYLRTRFVKWKAYSAASVASRTAEEDLVVPTIPEDDDAAVA
jgi:hypothetical protein